jgi:hypothetical protein
MSTLVVDTTLAERLSQAGGTIEFFDSTGRSLGWFKPNRDVETYDGYECPYSNEELHRIERAGGGRPIREILRDLENRG